MMRKTTNNKGFTLVEVIISIAMLGILAVCFLAAMAGYYRNLIRTREITKDVMAAQQGAEEFISDQKLALSGTILPATPAPSPGIPVPTPPTPTTVAVFGKTVTVYPKTIPIKDGTSREINVMVANVRETGTSPAVITADNLKLSIGDFGPELLAAYYKANSLKLTATTTPALGGRINKWYLSRTGFYSPVANKAANDTEDGLYPVFSNGINDDYAILSVSTSMTSLQPIKKEYKGRFLVHTVTPVNADGRMGETFICDKPAYLSALPDLPHEPAYHLDGAMIFDTKDLSVTERVVNSWSDMGIISGLAGRAVEAEQTVDSAKPHIFKSITGKTLDKDHVEHDTYAKYLRFDGVDDKMVLENTEAFTDQRMTLYVVVRAEDTYSPANKPSILSKMQGTDDKNSWRLGWVSENALGIETIDASGAKTTAAAGEMVGVDGQWHILRAQIDHNTNEATFRIDDMEQVTVACISAVVNNTGRIVIGGDAVNGLAEFDIGEILHFDGNISQEDDNDVMEYLQAKFHPVAPSLTIAGLRPLYIASVAIGDNYTLPAQIKAKMSNGATKLVDVSWSPDIINTSTGGTKRSTASTNTNPVFMAEQIVNVYGIDHMIHAETTLEQGSGIHNLPNKMTAVLEDAANTEKPVEVVWNGGVTTVNTDLEGDQVFHGHARADATKAVTLTVHVVAPIPVTNVTLNKTTLTLNEGTHETLVANLFPETATNRTVRWSCSDSAGAKVTVDQTGRVNAIAVGSATVTVTTVDGDKSATCTVTVVPTPVTAISLNKTSAVLSKTNTLQLIATVTPDNATNPDVTWTSSKPSAVFVDSNGLVTAISSAYYDSATITATSVSNPSVKATCRIEVAIDRVNGISINKSTLDSLHVGNSETLFATLSTSASGHYPDILDVVWSSSNPAVATVTPTNYTGSSNSRGNTDGRIKVLASGSTLITVTSVDGGYSATCLVTVGIHPTSITLNRISLTMEREDEFQLVATILPANAPNKNVIWRSDEPGKVSVSNTGLVKAKSRHGFFNPSSTITATTEDGDLVASCRVVVD